MVKCVVSGCPNRQLNVNRWIFSRPPKKFFNFPSDPARVKVWLAALRETDKQDSTDQYLICEDHFLPEDISANGVHADAIPIMPPCLDGHLGMIGPWGAESSEEEDQWGSGSGDDDVDVDVDVDDDDDDEGGDGVCAAVEPPAVDPLQQDSDAKKTLGTKTTSVGLYQVKDTSQAKRQDVSLGLLAQRFLDLLLTAPDGSLDIKQVATSLKICRQRVYDITSILFGISLIERQPDNRIKWIGRRPISCFLWKNQDEFQRDLENLKLVEDKLDTLIKSCTQQLVDVTNDMENSAMAYVTHEDLSRLEAFQQQTVIVVKAPEETKLEVLAPEEDNIQVHMKGGSGPIMLLTCDIGTGDVGTGGKSGCFVPLEESRIMTAALHTESSSLQSAEQSAAS